MPCIPDITEELAEKPQSHWMPGVYNAQPCLKAIPLDMCGVVECRLTAEHKIVGWYAELLQITKSYLKCSVMSKNYAIRIVWCGMQTNYRLQNLT